jgi:hypothetical protein
MSKWMPAHEAALARARGVLRETEVVEESPAPVKRPRGRPRKLPKDDGERRCPQCFAFKPFPEAFIGKRGNPTRLCTPCGATYGNWSKKSPEERLAASAARRRTSRARARSRCAWC